MSIQTRLIEYAHAGVTYEGLLAWDDAATQPRPGVAVAHTWAGRSEFEQGKAVELAEAGYVGFALDMFGKGVRGEGAEQCQALIAPLLADRALLQALVNKAVSNLIRKDSLTQIENAMLSGRSAGMVTLDDSLRQAVAAGLIEGREAFFRASNPKTFQEYAPEELKGMADG